MKKKISEEDINRTLNAMIVDELKPLSSDRILLIRPDNQLQLGNGVIDLAQLSVLASECKMLKEMNIWKIMQESIRFEAFKKMSEAETTEQMRPGKWMLHNLNSMNGVLEIILTKYNQLPKPQPKPDVSNPRQ